MGFRLIRCAFPGNSISPHDDCTGFWDLRLLGGPFLVPLRVFWYCGTAPAFWYWPLYWVWPSYVSARWLGVLFLAAQAGILARVFHMRSWVIFVCLFLFFPYAYQNIADTGPVGCTATSVIALYAVFRRWIRTRQLRWSAVSALIVAVGVWTKLVYFWLLPGLALLWLLECLRQREQLDRAAVRTLALQAICTIVMLVVFLVPYLLSTDPYDKGRFIMLYVISQSHQYPLSRFFGALWSLPTIRLLLHPLTATHRIFEVVDHPLMSAVYSILAFVTVPAWSVFVLFWQPASRSLRSVALQSLTLYGCFILTVLIIAKSVEAWAMHHVILAFPFLILSALVWADAHAALKHLPHRRNVKKTLAACGCVFAALNVYCWAVFALQPIRTEADWSRNDVHHVLGDEAFAARHIYVVLDYGIYFYQATYGPAGQAVMFREPLSAQSQIDEIHELEKNSGRTAVFVYDQKAHISTMDLLPKALVRCPSISPNAIWQILVPPNDDRQTRCFAQQ